MKYILIKDYARNFTLYEYREKRDEIRPCWTLTASEWHIKIYGLKPHWYLDASSIWLSDEIIAEFEGDLDTVQSKAFVAIQLLI